MKGHYSKRITKDAVTHLVTGNQCSQQHKAIARINHDAYLIPFLKSRIIILLGPLLTH